MQHLLGLAMAVVIYLVLLRRGCAALAGRAGRRARPARRVPASDRADDHARRVVRGPGRGGPGAAAVAAQSPRRGDDRRGRDRARTVGDGRPGRRGPPAARGGVRAGRGRRLAAGARPGRACCARPSRCRSSSTWASPPAHRPFPAVEHRHRRPLRAGGSGRRLRDAAGARQPAGDVPDRGAEGGPGRRRPAAQPALPGAALLRRASSGRGLAHRLRVHPRGAHAAAAARGLGHRQPMPRSCSPCAG